LKVFLIQELDVTMYKEYDMTQRSQWNSSNLPSKKQIANTRTGKVKGAGRSQPLHDFKVDMIEERPDQLFLRRRDIGPEEMIGFHNLQPFFLSGISVFGETVVEEDFEGGFFAVVVVGIVGDETDEATCYILGDEVVCGR
jgi:hypothetical protein